MPEEKYTRTKVKCCGLRRAEDIDAVNAAGADFAGFILTERFWRYVRPEEVKKLRTRLDPGIASVGVIVDEPLSYAASLVSGGIVDMIQLHGDEDNAYIDALRTMIIAPSDVRNPYAGRIIKAFKITCDADLTRAAASHADYILLDSGTGTGQTFDWRLMRDIGRPYFFAGGLNPDNAAEAVRRFHPFAVDVSSGIETDRIKDPQKVRSFVGAVKMQNICGS